jgi:hypothetical protein
MVSTFILPILSGIFGSLASLFGKIAFAPKVEIRGI